MTLCMVQINLPLLQASPRAILIQLASHPLGYTMLLHQIQGILYLIVLGKLILSL